MEVIEEEISLPRESSAAPSATASAPDSPTLPDLASLFKLMQTTIELQTARVEQIVKGLQEEQAQTLQRLDQFLAAAKERQDADLTTMEGMRVTMETLQEAIGEADDELDKVVTVAATLTDVVEQLREAIAETKEQQ